MHNTLEKAASNMFLLDKCTEQNTSSTCTVGGGRNGRGVGGAFYRLCATTSVYIRSTLEKPWCAFSFISSTVWPHQANLTELKSFGKPPPAVVNVTAAVLVLLSPPTKIPKDRSWNSSKSMMGKVDQCAV